MRVVGERRERGPERGEREGARMLANWIVAVRLIFSSIN